MIHAGQRTVIDELRSQEPGSNGPTEPAGELAAALEALRKQILGFERPHGWDGYRARRISAAACRAAVRFIERVAEDHREIPLPWAAPSALGAVALHWQSGNNHLIVRIQSASTDRVDVEEKRSGEPPVIASLPVDAALERVADLHAPVLPPSKEHAPLAPSSAGR